MTELRPPNKPHKRPRHNYHGAETRAPIGAQPRRRQGTHRLFDGWLSVLAGGKAGSGGGDSTQAAEPDWCGSGQESVNRRHRTGNLVRGAFVDLDGEFLAKQEHAVQPMSGEMFSKSERDPRKDPLNSIKS
jgi:hypothetical protein